MNQQQMNELFTYFPQSQMLMEKWAPNIRAVNEAVGTPLTIDQSLVLASCLENTKVALQRAEALFETTQPSDVGPFKKYAFDLVTAVVPNLIANEIVSVQPMTNRLGEIRYIKYLYGSNKGRVQAGTEFTSAFGLGNMDPTYSSEDVEQEIIGVSGDTDYEGHLEYYPVRPGTVRVTVDGVTYADNGAGAISGAGLTGTIDYSNGKFELTFDNATAEDVSVNYQYQLDTAPVQVPQVDIRIDALPVIAKSRKLRALYSFDAGFDLMRDYGVDINTALVSQISSEIKHEIDGEIMNDLYNQASATAQPITFDATAPTGVSQREHYQGFANTFIETSNAIFGATRRASATFLIVGTDAANVVESLDNFRSAGNLNPVGPHLVGYLNNTVPVYKNPYYRPEQFVSGYKGQGLFDAGYVHAPYQPIMTTSLVMLDDFVGRRGFATSNGKKMVNSALYCKGKIVRS